MNGTYQSQEKVKKGGGQLNLTRYAVVLAEIAVEKDFIGV